MAPVTVIDLRSLSYTGTTWLNLLAGAHAQVFTLVVPQRVYAALRGEIEPGSLCMLHGPSCDFWPTALEKLDANAGLYGQLAEIAGVSHVALNNPFVDPQGVDDLGADDVTVKKVSIVRDPRAVAASWLSRAPASSEPCAADAFDWVFSNAGLADVGDDGIRVRYEDVVADQRSFLARVGAHVGLSYPDDALRFWEHDHHPAGGNPGPIQLIRRYLNRTPLADPVAEQRWRRASVDPTDVANPARWRDRFTDDELRDAAAAGRAVAQAWGYDLESMPS